ncbi:MAG: SGNH/GDSL hydrolase family protein [Bdellovibrionales bacterium]
MAVFQLDSARVLVVGDSHCCAGFGRRLFWNLSHAGARVEMYGAIASTSIHWLEGLTPSGQVCRHWIPEFASHAELTFYEDTVPLPRMETLLRTKAYDLVVIALGTNSLADPEFSSSHSDLAQIVSDYADCLWIGPPHLRPDQAGRGESSERVAALEGRLNDFLDCLGRGLRPKCFLIDSRPATIRGAPGGETIDGIHRTRTAGMAWADVLARQMKALLGE